MERESGAALVEFALVVGLLMVFLSGILTYGLLLGVHQSVTHAASAAARSAAVVPGDDDAVVARAETVGLERLSWLGARQADVSVQAVVMSACPGTPAARCVEVRVSYPYGASPLIPSLVDFALPDEVSSTAVIELETIS